MAILTSSSSSTRLSFVEDTSINKTSVDAPPSFLERPKSPSAEKPSPSDRSNLQLYLQEIGKTALLKPEEEVSLANRIQKGDKAARDHMISANLRLVVKISMDYKDFGLSPTRPDQRRQYRPNQGSGTL